MVSAFFSSVFATMLWSLVSGKGTTPMEDKLETEIEYVSPRFFAAEFSNVMQGTRQNTFNQVFYNRSGKIESQIVNSIELFQRYQYKNRDKDSLCPMFPINIAAHVDWSFMNFCLYAENPSVSPRTIFVYTPMLTHFAETTLKNMDPSFRFVLLSGGTDATIPRSWFWNEKFRGFSEDMNSLWGTLLNDQRVIHWFAENHDLNHPKLSTLPTGMCFHANVSYPEEDIPPPSEVMPITARPLKLIITDRVRTGTGIWADRQYALDKCLSMPQYCFHPANESRLYGLNHHDFASLLTKYPFVACVHGAGIEPSPKAWEAVFMGCIPILQHSTLDDAYERLPVVFVTDWKDLFESPNIEDLLKKWLSALAPFYEEGSTLRNAMLERLKMKYWLYQVEHQYEHYMESRLNDAYHLMHNKSVDNGAAVHDKKGDHHPALSKRRMSAAHDVLPRRLAIEWND